MRKEKEGGRIGMEKGEEGNKMGRKNELMGME
jgi:hypothetical protein